MKTNEWNINAKEIYIEDDEINDNIDLWEKEFVNRKMRTSAKTGVG